MVVDTRLPTLFAHRQYVIVTQVSQTLSSAGLARISSYITCTSGAASLRQIAMVSHMDECSLDLLGLLHLQIALHPAEKESIL